MVNINLSSKIADNLILWLREYAEFHLDCQLADEQNCFPPHVLLDFANKGFFGLHISKKYGGLELATPDLLRVIEQLAAIDLTLAVMVIESIQGGHTLENYASVTLKKKYLKALAKGQIFSAGAMTESDAGSNPRAMKSKAIFDEKRGWIINGSKRWVGMGASAAVTAIYAHAYDANNNWLGMNAFLVPRDIAGLHIGKDTSTLGLRGFSKNVIQMENICISSEYLLGKIGEGMEIAQDNMLFVRLCLAAASIGAMKKAVQLMLRYAEQRVIATGLLLENPVTLVRLSEIMAIITALDALVYSTAHFHDKHPTTVPDEVLIVTKILGSEHLNIVVDKALQLLGARGYEDNATIAKMYRDARVFRIFEGPTEALNMYVGSRILAKNSKLENYIKQNLQQKKLLSEIKKAATNINNFCLKNKKQLFANVLTINYWSQALMGEIITYGLLLASVQYVLLNDNRESLQKARLWVCGKLDSLIQQSLSFSEAEQVTLFSETLKKQIADFEHNIGNVQSLQQNKNNAIDLLLQKKHINSVNFCEQKTSIPVQDLLTVHAKETPNAIAVSFAKQKISYKALNQQANKVAELLRQKGLRNNGIVALYFKRSIEMIVALVGVLKAGGAYLPLDPHYPLQNLQFMVDDANAEIILTEQSLLSSYPFKKEPLLIEDILALPAATKNKLPKVKAEDIGYVIYTSGSTGQPKGTRLPHRALSNLLNWHTATTVGCTRVLQFTTLNFDMSFIEIFSALTTGGELVLITEDERLNLHRFAQIIQNAKVQQLVLSVPFLKNLATAKLEANYFGSLKEIIVAGEQLVLTSAIKSFFAEIPNCKLLNYYGPSETHVVTAYQLPQLVSDWPEYPPIGKAIPNTKILLLDEHQKLVANGCEGEIFIGGVCLAQGYINNPSLSKEKFLLDPTRASNEIFYRSGDWGKMLSDGNIVYLGRRDEQVKVRGYRIELQHIEKQLLNFPGIKEAVVVTQINKHQDKQLEAFIVLDKKIKDNFITDIYNFLQEKLPIYMLPSVISVVENLPLTPSGKIDKAALASSQSSNTYSITNTIDPETDTEKNVVAILEEVFNIPIGINNSFVSIGGNSLLAMQIISKFQDKFQVDLPAYTLLSDPTLAHTALRIEKLI